MKRVIAIVLLLALLFAADVYVTHRVFTSRYPGANDFYSRWRAALVLLRVPALDTRRLSASWLVKAAVALVLGLNALVLGTTFVQEQPLAPLLGVESRADYVARRTGTAYTAAFQHVNALPPQSKTLFLWEPRTYACTGICLPDSLSHPDSVATGTVMRPSTLDRYAREAGFAGARPLDVPAGLWRFYRLEL